MAGMKGRSGGARPGSGPKRMATSTSRLRGSRQRGPVAPVDAPVVALAAVAAPVDLPAAECAVWDRLAPMALAARTLTPETADAFADLCEAVVVKREMLAQIRADGMTSDRVSLQMDESGGGVQSVEPKAHPLLGKWLAIMVRVEAGKARFLLTGTGKPAAAPEKPVDAFEEFDQPLRAVK